MSVSTQVSVPLRSANPQLTHRMSLTHPNIEAKTGPDGFAPGDPAIQTTPKTFKPPVSLGFRDYVKVAKEGLVGMGYGAAAGAVAGFLGPAGLGAVVGLTAALTGTHNEGQSTTVPFFTLGGGIVGAVWGGMTVGAFSFPGVGHLVAAGVGAVAGGLAGFTLLASQEKSFLQFEAASR